MGGRPAAVCDVVAKQRDDWEGGAAAFELDVYKGAAVHGVEDFAQERDRLALAGVEAAELGQGETAQGAGAVGGAVEGGIVDDDELAIEEMDVDLDAIDAEGERAAHGAQRVLRLEAACSAMADAKQGPRLALYYREFKATRFSPVGRSRAKREEAASEAMARWRETEETSTLPPTGIMSKSCTTSFERMRMQP